MHRRSLTILDKAILETTAVMETTQEEEETVKVSFFSFSSPSSRKTKPDLVRLSIAGSSSSSATTQISNGSTKVVSSSSFSTSSSSTTTRTGRFRSGGSRRGPS